MDSEQNLQKSLSMPVIIFLSFVSLSRLTDHVLKFYEQNSHRDAVTYTVIRDAVTYTEHAKSKKLIIIELVAIIKANLASSLLVARILVMVVRKSFWVNKRVETSDNAYINLFQYILD